MEIKTFLFDADGDNQELEFSENICRQLNDKQLLWVNLSERKQESVEKVVASLRFKNAPVKEILSEYERPKLDKFEHFYRLFINSVKTDSKGNVKRLPIDFLVSKNVIITVYEGEIDYFENFTNLEKGETHIGEMDAESFIASLMDLHIDTYFQAIEVIEQKVDRMDDKILTRDLNDSEFLTQMVELRRNVSKLRRWLLPHRDIFHAFSRPDFRQIAESDSVEHFQNLNQHFDSAVSTIESAREMVLSLFDLYTTRASHKMNLLVKNLTFATIIFGALSVIVGAFGMNFSVKFFQFEDGFWWTLLAMGILSLSLIILAKLKKWL